MTDETLCPTVDGVLAGAESLLDTHGWMKGVFWGPDGGYCLLGAMREAAVGRERGRLFCNPCLLYTSPSPRDRTRSRMPSSA